MTPACIKIRTNSQHTCGGLSAWFPVSLVHLNTWSPLVTIWGLEGVTSQEEIGHWGRAFRFQGSHHFELALLVCGLKCELSDVAGVPGLPAAMLPAVMMMGSPSVRRRGHSVKSQQ